MNIKEREIEEAIKELIGEEAIPIVKLLKKKKNVSEFVLADKLDMSINQIRTIIYKLDAKNLVTSTRKKDKKKGWYIYYWTFHPEKTIGLIISVKSKKIKLLREELQRESNIIYFICDNDDTKLDIETAMEDNYRCPECDSLLHQDDPTKRIKAIKKEIEQLESDIAKLNKLNVNEVKTKKK